MFELPRNKILAITGVIAVTVILSPAVKADELSQAYQKEYAYLEQQQRNLLQRLAEFRKTSRIEKAALERKLERLTRKEGGLQDERKQLNELLAESERTLESAKNNRDIFAATFEQAKDTLKQYGISLSLADDMPADSKVGSLYDNAFRVLGRVRSIHREDGSFFTAAGEKVSGQLLHFGQIASYGMSSDARGILVPAGEGMFRLWRRPQPEMADALFAGKMPESLPETLKIFIYENPMAEVSAGAAKTVLDYINSGGMVAWIIVALGVLAMILVMIRAVFLKSASSASEKILHEIRGLVARHDIDAALSACKKLKGSTSRVVSATLRNLDRDRDHLEDIVAESILHESPVLNRFGAMIIVIAAVTPLLGLLGTVTGMISTFDIITEFGTGDPKLLSGGISVALVTTQLGLVVAIPALIFGNLMSGWSNRIKDDMEKAALTVINIYDAPQVQLVDSAEPKAA